MDDVRPSTDSVDRSGQAAPLDDWDALRELLAAQQTLIANLEAQISVGQAAGSSDDGQPLAAERLAAETARLAELMDDLVRRESAMETARQELTEAQHAGLRSSTSLADQRSGLNNLQRDVDADRRRLTAETDRLANERHELDERVAVLDLAREELNEEKVGLVRGQQQLAADRALVQVERTELESRQAQAARDRQRLDADRQNLETELDRVAADEAAGRIATDRAQQQLDRQTARFEEQRKQLAADRAALVQERADVKLAQEAAKACQAEFTRAHERLEAERNQVSLERDRLVALESDTKNQRRRIAREFRVQHKTDLADVESRRDELESLVSATEAELRPLNDAAGSELHDELEISQDEQRELRQRLSRLGKVLNDRAEELRKLRTSVAELIRERDQLTEQLRSVRQYQTEDRQRAVSDSITDNAVEAALLRAECEGLAKRLAAAEAQLEAGSTCDPARGDLQRRFEMAVQDLRQQKDRNAELESQLVRSAGPSGRGGGSVIASANTGDWESQKRMLLESLEAEAEDEDGDFDSERSNVRLSIEATIRITDEVVAQKDRELVELRQLLEEQAGNIGSVAIGATAIAGILDQDELIAQELARLVQVQEEWREKLRQAEIDISVQRATIARDRAQIDEKLASHQSDLDNLKDQHPGPGGKPHRRWLSRLGLKENEE